MGYRNWASCDPRETIGLGGSRAWEPDRWSTRRSLGLIIAGSAVLWFLTVVAGLTAGFCLAQVIHGLP